MMDKQAVTANPETSVNLKVHLSAEGEEEFHQLVSLVKDDLEAFSLIIVRSDFSNEARDALLARLGHELAPAPLRILSLTRDRYDIPVLLTQIVTEPHIPEVIAVVGIEETPQITVGEAASRPPALAILNHGRETIRRTPHPLVVWCDPFAYAAMREHAPDFFDHYTGLFTFLDASPAPLKALSFPEVPLFDPNLMPGESPQFISGFSARPQTPAAIQFYQEQIQQLPDATPERARALIGLADALFASPTAARTVEKAERVETLVREALQILEQRGQAAEQARAHALLANILKRKLRLLNLENPVTDPEVQHHIEEALTVFTESTYPIEWASLQWLLSDSALEGVKDERILCQALHYAQAAQRVFTRQTEPYFWASCELNIGNIYANLPYSPRNFKRAISHFEAALTVYTEHEYPQEWAMGQLQLSKTYSEAAKATKDKDERSKLIRRALTCCDASLRGYSRLNELEHMALVLCLAALLWRELPTGNRRQHLRQCADCWLRAAECSQQIGRDALRAVQLDQAGDTLLELVRITKRSDELIEASQVFEAAHRAFKRAGDHEHAQRAAETVQQLNQLLEGTVPSQNNLIHR